MVRLLGRIYKIETDEDNGYRALLWIAKTGRTKEHRILNSFSLEEAVSKYVGNGWDVYSVTTDSEGNFTYHIVKRS